MKFKVFKYYNRTFRTWYYLSVGGTTDQIKEYIDKKHNFLLRDKSLENNYAITIYVPNSPIALTHVCFYKYEDTDKYDSFLWHECLHMASFTCKYIGIPTDSTYNGDDTNDEILAYLQREFHDYFKKKIMEEYFQ